MNLQEFESQYLSRLNPQQRTAVEQVHGPVLLLAVPGSGKTTVLVTRLGYMIYCRGIPPENILTVTYTVAATQDMKTRFVRLFGAEYGQRLTFRTLNGLCAVVINHYAAWKGTQPHTLITDEKVLNGVIRELLRENGVPFPSDQLIKEVRTNITYCKNMMFNEEDIQAHTIEGINFHTIYTGYQQYLSRNRSMDFDDQMVFTYRIFRQYPEILRRFHQRYPYLCVDEAQDTSKIQHAILRMLAGPENNLFMVGDEDQSIYGFRAAWPQALLDFSQTYPGAKVLMMERNYRSSRAIVERADAFIRRNQHRYDKTMVAHQPAGPPVKKQLLDDYASQYRYLFQQGKDCRVQTAVLFRNNDSALPLIDLLEREGIPYACRQRESFFFTNPTVRDLTDMLEFSFDHYSRERFLRFYYKLNLKVKKTVILPVLTHMTSTQTVFEVLRVCGKLQEWQMEELKTMQSHFQQIPRLSSYDALQRLIRTLGYGEYLKSHHGDRSRLDVLLSLAQQTPDLSAFLRRLRWLREVVETHISPPDCPFILSTIHASKGLEYERVIVMDVLDGLFPSLPYWDCGDDPKEEARLAAQQEAALEEERRLFYVAVTRAKRQLELLSYRTRFGESSGLQSTFVSQFMGGGVEVRKLLKEALPRRSAGQAEDISAICRPGTQLKHKVFGIGTLQSCTGSIAVIQFRDKGIKKLDLITCIRHGIMKPEASEP